MVAGEDVFIVGSGMTGLGKFADRAVRDLAGAALGKALADVNGGAKTGHCGGVKVGH